MKVVSLIRRSCAIGLTTFISFFLRCDPSLGQIRFEDIQDSRIKRALEFNESYLQSINEYHLTVFQNGQTSQATTQFWKGGIGYRILETLRLKGANSTQMPPRVTDKVYVFGEPFCKVYRYNEHEDLSEITPCDNRSVRAFHLPKNIKKSELIPLAEAMLLLQYPVDSTLSVRELIENHATKLEWVGTEIIQGNPTDHLRCVVKSPENSAAYDQVDLWIDSKRGGMLTQCKFVFDCEGSSPEDGFMLRVDKTLDGPECVVASESSRWFQGENIGRQEMKWHEFNLPSDIDLMTLGFKFPKFSVVDYCETAADGRVAESQEFRVVGDSENEILFRCKSTKPDLHDWCFDNGFPKDPRNLSSGRLTPRQNKTGWMKFGFFAVCGLLILIGVRKISGRRK